MGIREWIFRGITVRRALSDEDYQKAFNCRRESYGRFYKFKKDEEIVDEYDYSPHSCLLLAEDRDGKIIGTIRILDRRGGQIELDKFIDVEKFLSPTSTHVRKQRGLPFPRSQKNFSGF